MNKAPKNLRMSLSEECQKILDDQLVMFKDDDWACSYMETHKYRIFDDAEMVAKFSGGKNILNIGGAPYLLEAALSAQRFETTTIDLDASRHEKQIKEMGINVQSLDVESSQFEKFELAGFDLILMCEVFEHLRQDLLATMSRISSGMSPNSLLLLTTPNFFYKPVLMERLLENRSGPPPVKEWGKLRGLGHMGHVREYSLVELVEIFSATGFAVKYLEGRNSRGVSDTEINFSNPKSIWQFEAQISPLAAQEFVFLLARE
ncbi:MAG: class I SAM-dependent methyltransferase [Candidatus Puniceispirillaceae bacterium]